MFRDNADRFRRAAEYLEHPPVERHKEILGASFFDDSPELLRRAAEYLEKPIILKALQEFHERNQIK